MDKVTIELLGHALTVSVTADQHGLHIHADPKETHKLEEYLTRALLHAEKKLTKETLGSVTDMIQKGIEHEKSTNTRLSEPITKLPYDVPVATKEKLAELAELEIQQTGIKTSQTQILIGIINRKYNEYFGSED